MANTVTVNKRDHLIFHQYVHGPCTNDREQLDEKGSLNLIQQPSISFKSKITLDHLFPYEGVLHIYLQWCVCGAQETGEILALFMRT